jgi:serine/threonine protein kinase/PAS domain-containing protein
MSSDRRTTADVSESNRIPSPVHISNATSMETTTAGVHREHAIGNRRKQDSQGYSVAATPPSQVASSSPLQDLSLVSIPPRGSHRFSSESYSDVRRVSNLSTQLRELASSAGARMAMEEMDSPHGCGVPLTISVSASDTENALDTDTDILDEHKHPQGRLRSISVQDMTSITTAFLNSLNIAAAVVRQSDLTIVHYNDAAMRLFGYSSREAVNHSLQLLFPTWSSRKLLSHSNAASPLSATGGRGYQSFPGTRHMPGRDEWPSSFTSTGTAVTTPTESQQSDTAMRRVLQGVHKNGSNVWVELILGEVDESLSQSLRASSPYLSARPPSGGYLLATVRELTQLELLARQSRYDAEFEELDFLGKGGFGAVFKARNKIDGQEYAIKKVRLKGVELQSGTVSGVKDKKILREVKTFARISNHPNVVRYYAAWTEPANDSPTIADEDSCVDSHMDSEHPEEDLDLGVNVKDLYTPPPPTDTEVYFESEQSAEEESASTATLYTVPESIGTSSSSTTTLSKKQRRRLRRQSMQGHRENIEKELHFSVARVGAQSVPAASQQRRRSRLFSVPNLSTKLPTKQRRQRASAILYIQMQLCPFSDLRRWIRERGNNVDVLTNLRIFRQIVDGLNHIHEMGFVHRDLKPENIFVQDNHIYLSDFGLAKSITDKIVPLKTLAERSSALTNAVLDGQHPHHPLLGHQDSVDIGTYIYTDPAIGNWKTFSAKADIFSLGVIFVELFQPFSTAMERAVELSRLRNLNELPSEMQRKFPAESQFVRRLLSPQPELRPSGKEILEDPLLTACGSPNLTESTVSWKSRAGYNQSPRESFGVDAKGSLPPVQSNSTWRRSLTAPLPYLQVPLQSEPTSSVATTPSESERIRALESTVEKLMKQVQDLQSKLLENDHQSSSPPAQLLQTPPTVQPAPQSPPTGHTPHTLSTPNLTSSLSNIRRDPTAAILRPGIHSRQNRMSAPSLLTVVTAVETARTGYSYQRPAMRAGSGSSTSSSLRSLTQLQPRHATDHPNHSP